MMGSRNVPPATCFAADNNQECRLCLVKIKPKSPVYNLFRPWSCPWEGMEDSVVNDLNKLTNIGVTEADFLSEVICGTCNSKLMRACQFVKYIHYNDAVLKKRLETMSYKTAWPKPIQLDQNISYRRDRMDVEIKQEILSNDEYDSGDANSIDVEPEAIVRQTYSQYQLCTGDKRETSTAQEYMDEEYLDMVKEEQQPCGDSGLPSDCLLCTKTFKCVSGLKAHVIAQHSYKSVKRRARDAPASPAKLSRGDHVCQICRRAFSTPTDLMVHETCHNKWACYVCSVLFATFEQLTQHRARCRPADAAPTKLEDVKRQILAEPQPASEVPSLTCPSCPEKFTDAYYMKIHTEIHHSVASNEVSDFNSTSDAPNSENGTESTKESKNTESLESIFGIAMKETSAKDTESNDTQDSVLPNETSDDAGTNKDTESLESMLGVPTPENGNDSVDTNENLKYANNDSERINVVIERVNASVSEDNMPEEESVGENITGEEEANEIVEDNNVVMEDMNATDVKHNLQEPDVSVGENSIVGEKENEIIEENNVVMKNMDSTVLEHNLQEADESVGENNIGEEGNEIVEENNVVMEDMNATVVKHNLPEADESVRENNIVEANQINEETNVVMDDVNCSNAGRKTPEADDGVGENNTGENDVMGVKENNDGAMDTNVEENTVEDSVEDNDTPIQDNNEKAEQLENAHKTPEVTQTENLNKTETESLECILGIEVKSGQINPGQNKKASASEIEQADDNAESSDGIVAPDDIRIKSVTNNTEILESIFEIEMNRAKTDVHSIVNSN